MIHHNYACCTNYGNYNGSAPSLHSQITADTAICYDGDEEACTTSNHTYCAEDGGSSELSDAAIAGIAAGSVAGVGLLGAGVYYFGTSSGTAATSFL
tara:strand:- start:184 stop:474 length:291 start_codon:yes stop_codon:yes gene_type:complete